MVGNILATLTEENDLELFIDKELKFHKHISTVVSKVNKTFGIMKRIFDTVHEDELSLVYKHQIRIHLEYGNNIWHPRFVAHLTNIMLSCKGKIKLIVK